MRLALTQTLGSQLCFFLRTCVVFAAVIYFCAKSKSQTRCRLSAPAGAPGFTNQPRHLMFTYTHAAHEHAHATLEIDALYLNEYSQSRCLIDDPALDVNWSLKTQITSRLAHYTQAEMETFKTLNGKLNKHVHRWFSYYIYGDTDRSVYCRHALL